MGAFLLLAHISQSLAPVWAPEVVDPGWNPNSEASYSSSRVSVPSSVKGGSC